MSKQPISWKFLRDKIRGKHILSSFIVFEWMLEWTAFELKKLAIFDVLELLGKLTILIAAITYIADFDKREEKRKREIKALQYQAWEMIHVSYGQYTSGARVEAMQDLVSWGVPLDGIRLADNWKEGDGFSVDLGEINLSNGNLRSAQLSGANLHYSILKKTNLHNVDFTGANLIYADFSGARLTAVSLEKSNLRGANFKNAILLGAKGVSCEGLEDSINLEYAFRDPELACGLPVPTLQGNWKNEWKYQPSTQSLNK